MAYWGFLGFMKGYLAGFGQEVAPKILEIGVDKGQTFIPLYAHLLKTREKFQFTGVDIKDDKTLKIILEMMNWDATEEQSIILIKNNSLSFLEKMEPLIRSDEQYMNWGYWDLVLLDGDHNYYTVSRELEKLGKQLAKSGMIIIDDYDGRWSEKDEYFSEIDSYEEHLALLDTPEKTQGEKRGVKTAVDEFVENNPGWKLDKRVFPHHTPALLYREEHVLLLEVPRGQDISTAQEIYKEEISEAANSQKLLLAFTGETTVEGTIDSPTLEAPYQDSEAAARIREEQKKGKIIEDHEEK